jgi:hypothetical protein
MTVRARSGAVIRGKAHMGTHLAGRPNRNLRARGAAKLPENILDVPIDRALGNYQLFGELAVGQSAGD